MPPYQVRAIRESMGLTQGELAAAIGATRRAVQNWEADAETAAARAIPEPIARLLRLIESNPRLLDKVRAMGRPEAEESHSLPGQSSAKR